MVRIHVRPKRDVAPPACLPALTALLACFATTGDLRSQSGCATAAKALHTCMATNRGGGRVGKSSINHLLSQISKK